MTDNARDRRVGGYWAEPLMALLVLAGFVNVINRFVVDGKLPQPFSFDINDTFMDWFNTAYWAHNPGAFSVWGTVYPPISFAVLRVLGIDQCYLSNPSYARDCDWLGRAAIVAFYVISALICSTVFMKSDKRSGLWRAIAYSFGIPLLFTFERGNLILPCLICFALGHSDILKSSWARSIMIGISINFKPYLLLPALSSVWKRDWRELEQRGIATIGVYFVSLALFGSGTLFELVNNTANWVQFVGGLLWEQIYYSTSYAPFLQFDIKLFPTRDIVPGQLVDRLMYTIPIVITVTQAIGCAVLLLAWMQPCALTKPRIGLLLFLIYIVGQSPGGYVQVFLIFLLFLEPWKRPGPIVALFIGYVLSIPYDYVLANVVTLTGDSWLSGRPVVAPFGISIGTFLRPGLLIVMLWTLSLDSLALIIRLHRTVRPTLHPAPRSPISHAI